ncbi:septation protein A [Piscinibacter koreensis]|uniref:Inner membrane-spanning protein YciB n=1 Tax=Piscinibacter koreensis TaxID=2742824 RepID=A0A7Y6NRY3_9BURK|nr:septation protein A [Schlegelella koreensis]NUZ08216.1 septation protein A [Schlegelella koreensis]
MKLFFDFLPLILFFGAFKIAESHADEAARLATEHLGFLVSGGVVGPTEAPVLLATLVVVMVTLLQVLWRVARRKAVGGMLWATLVLVVVLGGATVWFHNPTFIMWKPSVLYWVMGAALWISQSLFGKNLLRAALGGQLELPQPVWQRLNWVWIAFFVAIGVLNLYVAYNFSTSTWATFKVFGITGLMFLFVLAQGLWVSRHVPDENDSAGGAALAHADAPAERP